MLRYINYTINIFLILMILFLISRNIIRSTDQQWRVRNVKRRKKFSTEASVLQLTGKIRPRYVSGETNRNFIVIFSLFSHVSSHVSNRVYIASLNESCKEDTPCVISDPFPRFLLRAWNVYILCFTLYSVLVKNWYILVIHLSAILSTWMMPAESSRAR